MFQQVHIPQAFALDERAMAARLSKALSHRDEEFYAF